MSEIFQATLPNGLRVMLKEIHTAPIISHWVWYRVGARDETRPKTGLSHWVEHMQFKGTPTFPANVLDKSIARLGGIWNAFTHLDWTTYYETLPAQAVDLALDLEADRMFHSLFRPEDVEAERTVILSEREGNENEPQFRLGEAVQLAAFRVHSYGHEVIGFREDLETIQRDDLFAHYQNFYTPTNALLAMAGDFDSSAMFERIARRYGEDKPGLVQRTAPPAEPATEHEQRLEVQGPGETTYLQICYPAPRAADRDFFAFTVLDSLLSGPSSLNMFGGGGISNKTSRLYHALIEQELAVSVHGGLQATIDPFLYDLSATVHPRSTPETVLARLDEQIDRLHNEPVTGAEIQRAIKQARALFAYGSENITNQAFWLGYAEMFASYPWFTGYLQHLESVTPQDVQRVAQKYLLAERRVVGTYLPSGNDSESIADAEDSEPDDE